MHGAPVRSQDEAGGMMMDMDGGMLWIMIIIGMLVVVLLVLGIAALIKYLFKR